MRRDLTKPSVPIGVQIPVDDFEALSALTPFGSKSWIIERSLEYFCAILEQRPELEAWAAEETKKMLYEKAERLGPTRELNAKIPTDLYVRFSTVLPGFGGITWFLRTFVRDFVQVLRNEKTVEEQIETTVNLTLIK